MDKLSQKNNDMKNVKLIVYDFDGVLTDNKVILREDGLESVTVNRSDGLAISMMNSAGIGQIIISREKNKVVELRAKKLGIPVIHGVDNKKEILKKYCMDNDIALSEVVFVGNDINDLDAMKVVGWPICPSDAYSEVRKVSKVILNACGGGGVVRELMDYIMS